jgi:hypothetical protein
LQERQRFDQRLIDSARPLAASHYKQRRQILIQSEFSARDPPIQTHQFGSNRRAGDFGVCFWKKRSAFLEAEHDRLDHPRRQSVRLSGNRVGLVNEGRNTPYPPGQHRRSRSESTHAQDHLRFEFTVKRAAE